MHPLNRPLLTILALSAALAGGCAKNDPPPPPKSPYVDIGPRKGIPAYLKDTVYERGDVSNTGPMPVTSYGLVVNLRYSGDSKAPLPVREWMVKEMYRHGLGSLRSPGYENVTPERVLADKRNAIVQVGAYVPPGARKGQRVDVFVQALPGSETASLAGGTLYDCDLRIMGANPISPGSSVNKFIVAAGPVFINPAYALETPRLTDGAARSGARFGSVLGGGVVAVNRPIDLRMRTPQWGICRTIENVINQRFQQKGVAQAQDEGYIHLYVPERYGDDWEHFIGVVNHLYLYLTPATAAVKAQELVAEAQKPGAQLEAISLALEGLGPTALPYIVPQLGHASPEVSYYLARAGAYLGDVPSEDRLTQIARMAGHPRRIEAIRTLGALPFNSEIARALGACFDSEESMPRIEAYRILSRYTAEQRIPIPVLSKRVGDFTVDVVESKGPPLIFATRTMQPRIAFFGTRQAIKTPVTFTAFDTALSIASTPDQPQMLTIFYRGDELPQPVRATSGSSVIEIAARLGGGGDEKLRFGYGEVVGILQSMVDSGKLSSALVLQDVNNTADSFTDDGETPSGGRPVGAASGAGAKGEETRPAQGVGTSAGRPN